MNRNEYLERARELYDRDKISAEIYNAMIENADVFCDYDDECKLSSAYAEIEYDDMDSAEAITGCRFDDMNYLRYMER